jgi:hypothetical protein
MPNYLYSHPDNNDCPFVKEYGVKFHLVRGIDARDIQSCPECGEILTRIFEGTTSFKYEHTSNKEKSIKRDLMEINRIEKDIALKRVKGDDVGRAKQEINRLKFE